jgi:hypothetical protein
MRKNDSYHFYYLGIFMLLTILSKAVVIAFVIIMLRLVYLNCTPISAWDLR